MVGSEAIGSHHRSHDQLELYALDRLSEAEVAETEEHLLACPLCRRELDQAADFAFAVQDAILERDTPSAAPSGWLVRLRHMMWDFGSWKLQLALAGGMTAVVLAVGIHQIQRGPNFIPAASLELRAMRGEVPSIPAAREVDLILMDALPKSGDGQGTGTPPADALRFELVTDTGSLVWSGVPAGSPLPGTPLRIKITKSLNPGLYLARLYRSPDRLIHEYGFRVAE